MSKKFPSQFICIAIYIFAFNLYAGCDNPSPPEHPRLSSVSAVDSSTEMPLAQGSIETCQVKEVKTLPQLVVERCGSNDFLVLPLSLESEVAYVGQEQAFHYARIIPCGDHFKGKRITSLTYRLFVPPAQGNEDVLRTFYNPETELPFVTDFDITTNRFSVAATFKADPMWDSLNQTTVIFTVVEEDGTSGKEAGLVLSERGLVLKLMGTIRIPERIGMAKIRTQLVDVEAVDEKDGGVRSENLYEEFISEAIAIHYRPESAGLE